LKGVKVGIKVNTGDLAKASAALASCTLGADQHGREQILQMFLYLVGD
jgi:hypothetical protein